MKIKLSKKDTLNEVWSTILWTKLDEMRLIFQTIIHSRFHTFLRLINSFLPSSDQTKHHLLRRIWNWIRSSTILNNANTRWVLPSSKAVLLSHQTNKGTWKSSKMLKLLSQLPNYSYPTQDPCLTQASLSIGCIIHRLIGNGPSLAPTALRNLLYEICSLERTL